MCTTMMMMSFGGRGLPSPGPAKPLALYMGRPAGKVMQPAPRYSTSAAYVPEG